MKICDFGLAKDIYRTNNYHKKTDGPLPVKWLGRGAGAQITPFKHEIVDKLSYDTKKKAKQVVVLVLMLRSSRLNDETVLNHVKLK